MSLRILERIDDCQPVRDIWNDLVGKHSSSVLQFDVTTTFEWTTLLWEDRLLGANGSVLVLENQGNVVGILPLQQSSQVIRHIRCKKIAPITEFYSGRCGFVLKEFRKEYLCTLIDYLYEKFPRWDVFEFTLVDGSESSALLKQLQQERKYHTTLISTQASPYINLEGTWQSYLNSLPAKFRSQLRNRTKKMEACGTWRYEEYRDAAQSAQFLAAVLEIERDSWKDKVRTSITSNSYQESFYKKLLTIAGERQWFSGHILFLNDEPIGYIFGLLFNNIFYGLKETYKAQYKELSPGHLIQMLTIQRLYEHNIRIYDFMGACEEHKMVWTQETYSRSTYILYNRTVKGTVTRLTANLAEARKNHQSN